MGKESWLLFRGEKLGWKDGMGVNDFKIVLAEKLHSLFQNFFHNSKFKGKLFLEYNNRQGIFFGRVSEILEAWHKYS